MKFERAAILLLLAILLEGCPVVGNCPLGPREDALMDNALLGKWDAMATEDTDKQVIAFYRFNDKEFYFESTAKTDDELLRGRVFITAIDNVNLINFQEIKHFTAVNGYAYLRYEIAGDNTLKIWLLNYRFLPNSTMDGAELVSFIRKNVKKDKLYEKAGDYRRIDE